MTGRCLSDWHVFLAGQVRCLCGDWRAGQLEERHRLGDCIEELIDLVGYLPEAQAVLDKYGIQRADTRQTPA